jgi:hypothetical protein
MKLPIPFLLYVTSLGLFGAAGWTVYEMVPLWKAKAKEDATARGQNDGKDALARGRGKGPVADNWVYTKDSQPWWSGLKTVNLTGKLPPPPPPPPGTVPEKVEVIADVRPLDQLFELVSLVYDGQAGGKGGSSHVIIRFKPEANVEPPEWWVRENTPPTPTAATPGGQRPADGVGGRASGGGRPPQNPPGNRPPPRPTPTATPMPASLAGREMLQKIWVDDGGDARRSAMLWPMKPSQATEAGRVVHVGTIRLVRVADDAQSAYFVRELPPKEGEGAVEPKEERLIKTSMGLSQDVLEALLSLQGRDPKAATLPSTPAVPAVLAGAWIDTEETMRVGNRFNIGRQDERAFGEDTDRFLAQLNVDTYVGKQTKTAGLIVRGADSQLAKFGVQVGDVLLEINGRKVESKGAAVSLVKGDYNRGVRTFQSKWLVNGQVVDRVYSARDR